ncbi:MAG: ABC transporter ATP-binding protein/permease [Candidatus Pacebacteria bacterium]|nr:ABC transporter ATP-binding protein/permease [Candidatus Paceibacterota bacterium]
MNYNLNKKNIKGVETQDGGLTPKAPIKAPKKSFLTSIREILGLMKDEKRTAFFALGTVTVNSLLNLSSPLLLAYAVDHYISTGNIHGVFVCAGILIVMYISTFFTTYFQMILTGGIGQRVVWKLRNNIFKKLQELPIQFFNQNKAGDLISRINNDTELLNQFFSQYITRFVDSIFTLVGIAVTVLVVSFKFGGAMLLPALCLLIITKLIGDWLKSRNKKSLQSIGGMSAEIQESLNNFKVIVAFNRRDYFKKKFEEANQTTFNANMKASIANSTVAPMYDLAANIAQLIVLAYGIYLISLGMATIGMMLAFFTYAERFYYPLRQFASIWTSFQLSLAGWDRINEVLDLKSNLLVIDTENKVVGGNESQNLSSADIKKTNTLLSFKNVSFSYGEIENPDKTFVIKDVSFNLMPGKTYALVGPTGGGKTTTASLMARLFDPTEGTVSLDGHDIRTFTSEERTQKIGFILQEPFLSNGTVRENILYGNMRAKDNSIEDEMKYFARLLSPFEKGLDTVITGAGEGMSLGQKQIIAFMRAILRKPELLILDEATANIDTVTETLLEEVLNKLPASTTKVIIAHRLNTIQNADEIFFVGGGSVTPAGSFDHAVEMLLHNKRES